MWGVCLLGRRLKKGPFLGNSRRNQKATREWDTVAKK